MKKKIIVFLSIFTVLLVIAGGFIGNYFYDLALNPNTDKSMVLSADNNVIEGQKLDYEASKKWYDLQNNSEVSVMSKDNLKLHAYQVKNHNANKWVIVFHGYMSQANAMFYTAADFNDFGYNVLLPDARGHGKSEGNYIGMGWDERKDALVWIDQIIKNNKNAEIVLYGISMGGATVMNTAGENLPANVKAIVEDCGFSSINDIFAYQLKSIFNLPSFPIINFASLTTKVRAGYFLEDGNTLNQLNNAKVPMMFIHGDKDTFVPFEMLDKVYNAANVEKEKLIVKKAGHGQAKSVLGSYQYMKKVNNFLNKYVN
ncbi:alpha/beta hydrolase [Mycoplasma sp. P36-A1]|uniref:alpha/beta hydrolase n=1 Tax=Mycoplasma sp. P36-A1 TaxID=3252900 RepID=UPI003C2BB93E